MATKRSLKVLDRLAVEGRTAFTTAEVRSALKLSPQATSNLLSRLAVEGLVDRVAGGRYVLRPIGAL
ncbi:MAG TPA: MarR family transcriptional regulator, partial [Candidatus Acidoferrales bacterium]|nr:MarR family transcriptional regulator [Candidatus Acidoferrales bacterium]